MVITHLTGLSSLLSPIIPIVQVGSSIIPAFIGIFGAWWATSIRRAAKGRFERGISVEFNAVYERNKAALDLQHQELKAVAAEEDALIRRINARSEAYAKHLEERLEAQASEIADLNKRLKILEVENENALQENLSNAKYINTLTDAIYNLGAKPPVKQREFDV